MSKWHGGKGSKQRPTDRERYEENYERIFKKNRNLIKEMKVRTINNIPFHEPIPEEIKKEYNL